MSELYGPFPNDNQDEPDDSQTFKRKGSPWIAWIVILGLCTFIVWRATQANEQRRQRKDDRLGDAMFHLQAKYILGATEVMPQYVSPKNAYGQIANFKTGPISQQQEFAVLAGELIGPKEAIDQLDRIERTAIKYKATFSPRQKESQHILRRLYGDYLRLRWNAPSVADAETKSLKKNLDWFGELALTPKHVGWPAKKVAPGAGAAAAERLAKQPPPNRARREEVLTPARKTFFLLFFGVGIGGLIFAAAGFIGVILWAVLLALGHIRLQFQTGISHGGVYAETFALWLLFFFGGSYAMRWLDVPVPRELLAGLMMLASLLVLFWPVLRGVSWLQVRNDIGWTKGQSPGTEPAYGVMCYVMTLPLVAVGAILVLVIVQVQQYFAQSGAPGNPFQRSGGVPAHPIVESLAFGTWWDWLMIFALAAIVAPIVEETMFRGVLHRQLREATSGWGRFMSVAFSSTLIGFVFAVIHPEGMVAVPVKMALAYGFTLAREWRGTLIPAMVGHGLNNTMATLLAFVIFR